MQGTGAEYSDAFGFAASVFGCYQLDAQLQIIPSELFGVQMSFDFCHQFGKLESVINQCRCSDVISKLFVGHIAHPPLCVPYDGVDQLNDCHC